MEAIDGDTVIEFLNYLENYRKNKCKTVNNRLAAIKSFMDFVSHECPEYLGTVRKVKAIPFRKVEKKDVCYLTKEEKDSRKTGCQAPSRNMEIFEAKGMGAGTMSLWILINEVVSF
jgi:hypothetical protein